MSNKLEDAGIDWVIIGKQTNPDWMPEIEWVKDIKEKCDDAGVPVFLKNNLSCPPLYDFMTCVLRQQMPKVPVVRDYVPVTGTVAEFGLTGGGYVT